MGSFNKLYTITLLALAILASAPGSGEADPTKWHVHVVNGLSPNRNLFVHCKSKDDDLGVHNLAPGSETNWEFRENFWLTTEFYCYLRTDRNEYADYDVFWVEKEHTWLHDRCQFNCIWTARDDGSYLRNNLNNTEEFMHKWGDHWSFSSARRKFNRMRF